jgi:hypothetical protein
MQWTSYFRVLSARTVRQVMVAEKAADMIRATATGV